MEQHLKVQKLLLLYCKNVLPDKLVDLLFTQSVSLLHSDESFAVSHCKRGTLGMANRGPHTNGSQFYITLQPTLWMDRTYVAFGFV